MKWLNNNSKPIVVFKLINEHYVKEESGIKPNTVRQINPLQLKYAENAIFVQIQHVDTGKHFTRKITDLSFLGSILGKPLTVISWNPNEVIA